MTPQPRLWYENLYRRLRLPFPVGVGVGFLPFVVLSGLTFFLSGYEREFFTNFVPILPFYFLVNVYVQFAARNASARIFKLSESWQRTEMRSISLDPLFGLRGATISSLVVYSILLPLFNLDLLQTHPVTYVFLVGVVPWLYYGYFFGTFFWVLAYSAYSVYQMGRLPLELKHFTEDRTLGLREFGSVSLRLTGIYVAFVALFVIPNTFGGFVDLSFLLLYAGLFLLASVLFLLPLISLHRKLVSEKRKIVIRFSPKYKEMIQEIETNGTGNVDGKFTDQLNTTRQVLQEAGQIREWPFDTGIIVRLSAIVLSVVAILLSRILSLVLHL